MQVYNYRSDGVHDFLGAHSGITARDGRGCIGSGRINSRAPPLALEERGAMRSGSWHQLCQYCKDADYSCRRSKIIQIDCTRIWSSNLVQDSIKGTYDTIVLWMNTTINHMYNVNVPKNKLQKNADPNIEYSIRYKAESMGQLFQLANFWKHLQAKTVGEKYSFKVNIIAI